MSRVVMIAALAAGCGDVTVEALTVPPPGKVAQLDAENRVLELSAGVAFAFECTEANGGYSGPCRDSVASSENPDIAGVFPSYLDTLAPAYSRGDLGPRSRSAFVVVGLAAGTASLTVTTPTENVAITVHVVP